MRLSIANQNQEIGGRNRRDATNCGDDASAPVGLALRTESSKGLIVAKSAE